MNNILLTGAGFTKNFGGYLASEMWYKIYNSINSDNSKNFKDLLKKYKNRYDFEGFYSKVLNGKYSDNEKSLITDVVFRAYVGLDNVIKHWESNGNSTFPIREIILSRFLNQFNCFFTTNQDLLVERKLTSANFVSPIVGNDDEWRRTLQQNSDLKVVSRSLPKPEKCTKKELDVAIRNLQCGPYIKLHGSCHWLKYNSSEPSMVIGSKKDKQINNEPLLKGYMEVFKENLNIPNTQIVIIGYGFNDKHINEEIIKAILKSGLKIFIIDPADYSTTIKKLNKLDKRISNKVEGYFKLTLVELFPLGHSGDENRRDLKECLRLDTYNINYQ